MSANAKSKYFDARKGAKRRGKARKGAGNLAEQKVTEGSEDFVLRKVFTLDYSGLVWITLDYSGSRRRAEKFKGFNRL